MDFLNDKSHQHLISLFILPVLTLDGAAPIEKTNNAGTLIPGIKAQDGTT